MLVLLALCGCGGDRASHTAAELTLPPTPEPRPPRLAAPRSYGPFRFRGEPVVAITTPPAERPEGSPDFTILFRLNRPLARRDGAVRLVLENVEVPSYPGPFGYDVSRRGNCYAKQFDGAEMPEALLFPRAGDRVLLVARIMTPPRGRISARVRLVDDAGSDAPEDRWFRRLGCR